MIAAFFYLQTVWFFLDFHNILYYARVSGALSKQYKLKKINKVHPIIEFSNCFYLFFP